MAGKRLTKAQVIAEISDATELDKKSVGRVFDTLSDIIRKQLAGRGAPGEFGVPGLVKLRVVKKPATKERQGINPFTKEPITIPAKPASKKVRATALKALKDLVQ
jgi:nucleoid DNA-binding protein